ncbi:MAG: hypothetical protein S4CHLAM123_06010 [Chlamydiales bacterium]|nr:hypothetical protein [Chlamydiales bacterium]
MSTQPIEKFLRYISEYKIEDNEFYFIWSTKNHQTMCQTGAIYACIEKIEGVIHEHVFNSLSALHSYNSPCKQIFIKFTAIELSSLENLKITRWSDQYFHTNQHKVYLA